MSIFELIKGIFGILLSLYALSKFFHFLFPSTSHKIKYSFSSLRNRIFSNSHPRNSGKSKPNQQTIKPNRRVGKPASKQTSKPKKKKLSKEEILQQQRERVAKKQKAIKERERKQKERDRLRAEEKDKKRIEDEKKSNTSETNEPSKIYEPKKQASKPENTDYVVDQKVTAPGSFDDELLFVNYDAPQSFEQSDPWSYAVAKFPERGCVMKPPAEAKFELRGKKEEFFEHFITKRFPSELTISGSYALPTGENTRPFEPDIAILYKDNSSNFFIDIEIDEPYGGISRSAIHHTEDTDDNRDLYFIHRGWIVIRFAEIQIHKEPMKCAAYIAKIIREIAPNISFNTSLLSSGDPTNVERWSRVQAEKWARINYRENYLGIDVFKKRDQGEIISSIEDRGIDREVEARVKYSPNYTEDNVPGVNRLNNPKDKRIRFDPVPHQYYIDGVPVRSVTSVVDHHFPTFDANSAAEKYLRNRGLPLSDKYSLIESWNRKGENARTKGTKLHLLIEKHFAGESLSHEPELSDEIEQFKLFLNDHDHIDPVRTEWRIFDERIRIAGTIDFLSKNSDGTFDIYDWKRSKKLVDSAGFVQNNNPYQSGFGRLSVLDDTSYNRYTLQQGIYKYILENRYDIKIQNMHLIVLHPRYDSYHKLEIDFMEKPIRYILGYVR